VVLMLSFPPGGASGQMLCGLLAIPTRTLKRWRTWARLRFGCWLERAGFPVGRMVNLQIRCGRLVIEAEPERVPAAELLERIARVSEDGSPKRELDAHVRRLKRDRID
jgi:hypothetical protein